MLGLGEKAHVKRLELRTFCPRFASENGPRPTRHCVRQIISLLVKPEDAEPARAKFWAEEPKTCVCGSVLERASHLYESKPHLMVVR